MNEVRQPAVADYFYPGEPRELATAVDGFIAAAAPSEGSAPKALIVPHAGYVYSGPVAASAYAQLAPLRDRVRRVVLVGPCHRVPIRGMALSSAAVFRTPLGDVPLEPVSDEIRSLPGVEFCDPAHADEHSLEVHLPFLQRVLGSFALIPIAVGDASPGHLADVLDALWDGDSTLIVVSSDLSHYLAYDAAVAADRRTCTRIERLDPEAIGPGDACGCIPIRAVLRVAKRHGLVATTLDLRNSGDTAGPKSRVVGYGAWTLGPAKDGKSACG